jgi:hypothetical protein
MRRSNKTQDRIGAAMLTSDTETIAGLRAEVRRLRAEREALARDLREALSVRIHVVEVL